MNERLRAVLSNVLYIAAGLLEIKDEFDPNGNPFVRLLMVGLIVGVLLALYILLYKGLYEMNVRTINVLSNSPISSSSSMSGSDISDLYKYLG